jgi:hypothetical protein
MAKFNLTCPFSAYKWRWATLTPTESLNKPSIYFGCLKVLVNNEGKRPSSQEVFDALETVEKDLKTELGKVNLARQKERNIFRNSSQYWKMSGLLINTENGIQVSELAKDYVSKKINKFDYATHLIRTLTLPNPYIEDQKTIEAWQSHKLEIRPLEELLKIFIELSNINTSNSFITYDELLTVIIPMFGNKYSCIDITQALLSYRNEKISGVTWYLERRANDHRSAKEFLLFLRNYEIVDEIEKGFFFADENSLSIIRNILDLPSSIIKTGIAPPAVTQAIFQKRERKTVSILSRPKQQKFRKDLLNIQSSCLLSGVTSTTVLQACHIIPVKNDGVDHASNGIVLRSDLHILYDIGYIKILEDGSIQLSNQLLSDPYYSINLPSKVTLPTHINLEHIRIRNTYDM